MLFYGRLYLLQRSAGDTCGKEKKMEEKKYETGCCTDPKNHIKGICCNVKSCAYHDGKCDCYAGSISVGPSDAKSVSGTACVTFKPREY